MKILQFHDIKQMSVKQLQRRLEDLDEFRKQGFGDHGGSPGEWVYEEMDAIDFELMKRQ